MEVTYEAIVEGYKTQLTEVNHSLIVLSILLKQTQEANDKLEIHNKELTEKLEISERL